MGLEMSHILISLAITLIIYSILKLIEKHSYWENKGIPYLKASPLFGNLLPAISGKLSIHEIYKNAYFKFPNEKVVGIYEFYKPVLIIRDPDLIDSILVKDFQHFTDHPQVTEDGGIFSNSLFMLKGKTWRAVRHKSIPTFTNLKLKDMFNAMLHSSDKMISKMKENVNTDYNVAKIVGVYAINILANTAFGIEINDEKLMDELIIYAKRIFAVSPTRLFVTFALAQNPKVAGKLGFKFIDSKTTKYFKTLINNIFKQREEGTIERNDFIQTLVKIRQQNALRSKQFENEENNDKEAEITNDILISQAFKFLSAGYDPIVTALQYIMYDFALYPEVQQRARENVKEILLKHNNQYSYECIQEMTYLDQCVQESSRLHTIPITLFRECTKNYYIPEQNLEIQKGQKIVIPLLGIHDDPKYYPDPEIFNPDRFTSDRMPSNSTFLPFGQGPRICIGMKYALIILKLGMAKILSEFKFTLSPKCKQPLGFDKRALIMVPDGEVILNMVAC